MADENRTPIPTDPAADAADEIPINSVLETTTIVSADPPVAEDDSMKDLIEPTAVAGIEAPAEAPAPAPVAPAAPAAPQPIKCEFCGMVYEKAPGKFCDRCGRTLNRTMRPLTVDETDFLRCPECATRNKLGVRICVNCGTLIRFRGP